VMAKTVVDLKDWRADHPFTDQKSLERTVRRALREELAEGKQEAGFRKDRKQEAVSNLPSSSPTKH
jgi:hypothetical protein